MLVQSILETGLFLGGSLAATTVTHSSCKTKYGTPSVESAKTRNETFRVPFTTYGHTITVASTKTVTPSPITIVTTRYTTVSARGRPPHAGQQAGGDDWIYNDGRYEWKHNVGRGELERYQQHVNCK